MSGIEVAGLALGALPLIIQAIKVYADGVSTVERYFKYEIPLRDLHRAVEAEYVIYQNTCEELLNSVVGDNEDRAALLDQPGGPGWKRPELEATLKERLSRSYPAYIGTMDSMMRIVSEIKRLLKLDKAGKLQLNNSSKFRKEYHRLRFSLKKSEYDGLVSQMQQLNATLRTLTQQALVLESTRSRRQPPDFDLIRAYTAHYHSNGRAGKFFEPRTHPKSVPGDDSLKDPFVSCNTNHVSDNSPADNSIPVSGWEGMALNRSLFALGILLIELCLGKPFEELRDGAMAGKGGVREASDFAVASQLLDEVMNEFGDRWAYIEASLNDIFTEQNESVDAKTYVQRKMGLYTAIFNYCSRERRPGLYERRDRAAELHGRLDEYLKQHLQGLRNASTEYATALNRYEKAAQYNSQAFSPVNREYAFLEQDQGKKVHDIYSLHMIRWKEYMGPDPREGSMTEAGTVGDIV
ncbi:uncharacterized protein LTHEOB_3985 [Lasiodiplodia theobromae]|uniref:uncharacterized protein n=1 Tax=Lasiodiplodia theobromae TaxID=45133 RepID=UPI0015C37853|nr:uncharacterized protein LTHEOB_3985 [Lasiodiplodia theobromae]KAF4546677.1 hypothetical protein LTHEOB_3985 [Lasiodiplodia theobromae]